MVAREGGYYGTAFQVAHRLTQGDPLSPTILNVVVDSVVRSWVTGVIAGVDEQGECGKEGRHQSDLFYAEDDMVALYDPRWLQGAFNTLVSLFDRVFLQTNVGKTVSMVCRPCQAAGNLLEAAYGRRITREGPTYRERLNRRLSCRVYRELMAVGSLESHLMTQHGRVAETRQSSRNPAAGDGPQTFRMIFPAKGGPRSCPVEGCPGRADTRTAIRVHFLQRHVLKTVVILEEVNLPHPRCARCDMLVPRQDLNGSHPAIAQFVRGAHRKRRRLVEV